MAWARSVVSSVAPRIPLSISSDGQPWPLVPWHEPDDRPDPADSLRDAVEALLRAAPSPFEMEGTNVFVIFHQAALVARATYVSR